MAKILLVDDNEDFRYVFGTLLAYHGHVVHDAADGAIGVRMAREIDPDVIVLDLAMPVMDGEEAMTELKTHPRTSSIPIVALTALAPLSATLGQRPGFDAFLTKPVELRRVLEVFDGILHDCKTTPTLLAS
jgi:two-component system, cell cycle response regulator DivK